MTVRPISPDNVQALKNQDIPPVVIAAANELIVAKWTGSSATVKIKDLVAALASEISSELLFANHWLDIEPLFRDAGWQVEFDKPGYNESYDAYFIFTKK